MTIKELKEKIDKYPENTELIHTHLLTIIDDELIDLCKEAPGYFRNIDDLEKWANPLARKYGWTWERIYPYPENMDDPISLSFSKERGDETYTMKTWNGGAIYLSKDGGPIKQYKDNSGKKLVFIKILKNPDRYT